MWAFAQLGFYISKWHTIKIMAITNKLFICLKETFPAAAGSTLRMKTHSLCLWKGKMKVWLVLLLLHCHLTRALRAGEAQSTCASRYFLGLYLIAVLAMKTPWNSGSKALPERCRKGCKTEAILHTKLPPSNNPHLTEGVSKSNCLLLSLNKKCSASMMGELESC